MYSNGGVDNKEWLDREYDTGIYRVRCTIPAHLFNDGSYNLTAIIVRDYNVILVNVPEVVHFELHDDGSGRAGYTGPMMGVLRPRLEWQFTQVQDGFSVEQSKQAFEPSDV